MVIHIALMRKTTAAARTTRPTAPAGGRPRGFDASVVLDTVVEAFHRHGLVGTTYEVLEAATGVRRQSLIYAFGDKQTLLAAVLARYAERRVGEIEACLAGPGSPAAAIRHAFALWLDDTRTATTRGCLLVNTAGELAGREPALAARIEAATVRLVRAFAAAFERARATGELCCDAAPGGLAAAAVALGDGALLHARNAGSPALAEASFAGFLAAVLR